MSQTARSVPTYVPLLIALVLSFGTLAALAPSGESQSEALHGTVQGLVTNADGAGLAKVSIVANHSLFGSRNNSTASDGGYGLSLEPGKWTLTFERSGYETHTEEVDVATARTKSVNVTLQAKPGAGRGVTLTVLDSANEAPVEGAEVTVQGTSESGTKVSEARTTDAAGEASFSLPAGGYEVKAIRKGFGGGQGWIHVATEPVEQTLFLYEVPVQTVKITGRVTDTATGSGVKALVELRPDHRDDVVYAQGNQTSPEPDRAVASSTVCYGCGGNGYNNWNSTVAKDDGTFEMWAYPGSVVLSANKYDYLVTSADLVLEEKRSYTQDLALEAAPPKDVTVKGKVVEAGTGKALANAYVHLNGLEYPSWESATTDASGSFEITTRRGYTTLSASHWEDASAPDCPPDADCIAMPRSDTNVGRGHLSRTLTVSLAAGETRTLTFELPKRPEATATILGYVLDGEKGIPNVSVNFYNEETGDWGSATTDEDGSYRIRVRGGWFQANLWAPGYFGYAESFRVADGDSLRKDLRLVAGEARQMGWWGGENNGCCWATPMPATGGYGYAEERAVTSDAAYGAPGSPMQTTASMGADQAARGSSGGIVYEGGAGGLGPYDPSQAGETFEKGAPAWGAMGTALALVGAALFTGRRRSA